MKITLTNDEKSLTMEVSDDLSFEELMEEVFAPIALMLGYTYGTINENLLKTVDKVTITK